MPRRPARAVQEMKRENLSGSSATSARKRRTMKSSDKNFTEKKASSSSRPATCAERATKLSFLSTSTCAASVPGTAEVQICLKWLERTIEKSDAMLYAPSVHDVEENCKIMSLKCYMLELIMVLDEKEIKDKKANCILDFNDTLPPEDSHVGCPPCEAYSLRNITIFLDRLNNLLEEMTALWNTHST